MKTLPSPFGLNSPFGKSQGQWLYGLVTDLVADPPEVGFFSARA